MAGASGKSILLVCTTEELAPISAIGSKYYSAVNNIALRAEAADQVDLCSSVLMTVYVSVSNICTS